MALPGAIKAEIEQLPNIDHQLHLKWLPSVETSFSLLNFQIPWKQFIERFDGEVIYGIQVCGDALSRNRPEKVADPKLLEGLLKKIIELLAELEKAELSPETRAFMFEHLLLVKNACEEYQIRGIKPLEAEVERLTGALALSPWVWIQSRDSSFGRKFWAAMGNLALVTTIVVGQIQIGHEIFDALSGNPGEGTDQAPSIEINIELNDRGKSKPDVPDYGLKQRAIPSGSGKNNESL